MTTFVRVVESGSLTGAAKQLRISAASVSRQLATLESHLGIVLIVRSTRRMAVTDAGQRYFDRCTPILRAIDEAQTSVRAEAGLHGLVTISAPVAFGIRRIAPHVKELLAGVPTLQIDLRLEGRVVDLVAECVDIAIRAGIAPPDSPALVAHELTAYRRILVASPAYLNRRGVPSEPGALTQHEILLHLPASGSSGTWTFHRGARESRVDIRSAFRTNALDALREASLRGAGIALLPDWLVEHDIRKRRLRHVLRSWQTALVPVIALCRVEIGSTPRVRAVLGHLKSWLRS